VSALAEVAEYVIGGARGLSGLERSEIEERIEALRNTREAEVPKGDKLRAVRPTEGILELDVREAPGGGFRALRVVLALGQEGALRPVDVVRLLLPEDSFRPELATIHRTGLFRRTSGVPTLEPIR
jgi:hypothetical protein